MHFRIESALFNNFLEYSLGGDPTDASTDSEIAPSYRVLTEGGSERFLEYSFRQNKEWELLHLNYAIEHASDLKLGDWSEYEGDLMIEDIPGEDAFQLVTVKIEMEADDSHFARLKVSTIGGGSGNGPFIEAEGLVVIEAESVELPAGEWEEPAPANRIPGYMGDSYIIKSGRGITQEPGDVILRYPIEISKTGTYEFAWHCRNGLTAEEGDKENDSFLRLVADKSERVLRGVTYNNGDRFWKVHLSSLGEWSWLGNNPRENGPTVSGLRLFATFDNPGLYEIQITGRSAGHTIDRLVLWHSDVDFEYALDPARTESPRGASLPTAGAVDAVMFTME